MSEELEPMKYEDPVSMRCHCGRDVEPRDPDPWEGRMDDYCHDCASNRCDCYPDECPVKYGIPVQPFSHAVRRMLQALDACWLHCDGLPPKRYPRGRYDMETWWNRFERYREQVEAKL